MGELTLDGNAIAGLLQEVFAVEDIHRAFRAKAAVAMNDQAAASQQDWEGLGLIFDAILSAFKPPAGLTDHTRRRSDDCRA